jgi:hypothetical protein
MIVDKGGCPYNFPGVGDVSYVKDLITEEIVSRDFSCSIFGLYSHPQTKIGWVGCIILYKYQTQVFAVKIYAVKGMSIDLHTQNFLLCINPTH